MKKVEFKDVSPYLAPKHFGMVSLMLHGKETGSEKIMMGLSHFLPGGGAEADGAPVERIYFVVDGEITVKSPEENFYLKQWDSIHIMPGEHREIINETNKPASMLVVVVYPD